MLDTLLSFGAHISGWIAVAPLVIALLGAGCALVVGRRDALMPYVAALFWLGMMLSAGLLFALVRTQGMVVVTMSNWAAPYGISFAVDLMSAMFVLAIMPIVGAVLWLGMPRHAAVDAVDGVGAGGGGEHDALTDGGDTRNDSNPQVVRPYLFTCGVFGLSAGLIGAYLTGDIFNLYVWFEVLLISTLALMSLAGNRKRFEGLLKYATLNLVATTLFLVSVAYVFAHYGTLNFADLAYMRRADSYTEVIPAAATVMMLAFAMKAAAFPLMFWLPASYHVPLPYVAALCAAVISKVGSYAIIRTGAVLNAYSTDILSLIAIGTLVFAGFGAVARSSPMRMSAYVVIASTGAVLFGVAVGGVHATAGAIAYALQSMYVLFALFLVAGIAEKLCKQMPATSPNATQSCKAIFDKIPTVSVVFLVGGFAAAGLPPFSSFLPKVMMLTPAVSDGFWYSIIALLISSALMMLAFGRVWSMTFLRARAGWSALGGDTPAGYFAPARERVIIVSLGIVILVLGVFPESWLSLVTSAASGLELTR